MTASPQPRVPHLHDGFIVAKVGIVRSTTAPAHLNLPEPSKVKLDF